MSPPLTVVHFHRRPLAGYVSIERLFDGLRQAMPADTECVTHICPHFSKAVWPRLLNMMDAARRQGQINHITGDVHYLALALNRRRTLLTIHDCAALRRLTGWRRAVLKLFWFTWPVRCAALVTVVSETTRQELLHELQCDPAKIRVVPNCVGPEFVPVLRPFAITAPEVLHLGTAPNKNLERLIPALAGLSCRLRIVGHLSSAQSAMLSASGIPYTNLPSATDQEVLLAFQNCDLVFFASTDEGFGLPILEAQATGRPVITSRVSSMPEVAGAGACLVDPFDVAAIRQGILQVCQDAAYRQKIIAAGFENVKRFSAPAIAARYAELYRELASPSAF